MSKLTATGCRARRNRLLQLMASRRFDAVAITDVRDVYYLTAALLPAELPVLYFLDADGRSLLFGPAQHSVEDVDDLIQYDWNYRGTRNPTTLADLIQAITDRLQAVSWQTLGVQHESLLECVRQRIEMFGVNQLVPIDSLLTTLQRRKDADEVDVIRASIRANMGAYDAVAAAIRPGANELDVLSAGRQGAARAAGEKVFHDGDYQCGQYNGPARDRCIEAGELYIVDAWTCYRGYWSDMSRTFIVGTSPSDEQQALFDHIRWVLMQSATILRPGVDGTDVYRALDELIRKHPPLAEVGLIHHGGHAIGLRSHEMPDINLERGGVLETGNVICIEPGGYFAAARHGVRLENMFLITENGCDSLCPGQLELTVCGG